TIEPTVEPTLEPTIAPTETPEPLPNLVFAAPEGWDAPLVVSNQPGTHTNDELVSGSDAFVDLAVLNNGTSDINTLFTLCLKVDGEQRQCWDATALPMGEYYLVEDWQLTALAPGAHNFEVLVDVNNNLLEVDKLDNALALDLTWPEPDMEELSVGSPLVGDAFPRPNLPEMSEQSSEGSSAPSYWDTSAYMVGSVAIGVILPESTGNGENWTATELQNVKNEIQQGLQRWDDWSTTSGDFSNIDPANTNVTFVYDFNESISTTYEPITMSSGQIGTWINQVMANMPDGGYNNPSGYWARVYDYLNDLREEKGTDWAVAIFVVDSSNDYATEYPFTETPGAFNDGYFGFAYLNGPLIMMTYDNAGYTIGRMDEVTQH
ncbi:MAG: hypothetical protein Q7U74_13265, partial [Saprospiraceae bacterium]|nr:hypothetical protein [Saprospiraceae bacterium]